MNVLSVLIGFAFGFYLFFGAYKDYDWFFTGRKMRRALKQMGRRNARIVYIISGIVIMVGCIIFAFVGHPQ